ncbi:Uncharacterised protein [Mycobacteroides abscessus subsp. massiliense]|nr:Uncharacterised protein [Mycobacteroides abscessus subsp. massiliense]
MERQALISEHDIVGTRHRDHKSDARGGEHGEQHIHIIGIGFGMVGVADVHSHRQSQ